MKLATFASRCCSAFLKCVPTTQKACSTLNCTGIAPTAHHFSSWVTSSKAFRTACSKVSPSTLLMSGTLVRSAQRTENQWASTSQAIIRSFGRSQTCKAGLGKTLGAAGFRQYSSGGWGRRRSYIPHIPDNTALYGLMGANVAVFLLWRADPRFAALNFMTSLEHMRAGRLHTLVTSAFSQRDSTHLFSNMIGLYFFGRSTAASIGGKGLILLYLACGTLGSLVYVVGQAIQNAGEPKYQNFSHRASAIPALGSSGAVNGIVMFDILLFPSATILLYGILPMPAWGLGAIFLGFDIYGALGHGRSNVGYTVHLAGAATGALACWGVRRGKIPSRWRRW